MFFYEGCSCPVCKQPFTETDDIVTCPDCGAPHHRACWQQEKHCFYAATHNTSEQWRRETSQSNTQTQPVRKGRFCGCCGAENPAFAEFCSRCGREMDVEEWKSAPTQSPPPFQGGYREYQPYSVPQQNTFVDEHEDIDGVKAVDLHTFVGKNAHYYIPRFRKMSQNGTTSCWNWAACLLTPYWLWYRKQYLYGSLVLIFELLQTACTAFFLYGYLGATSVTGYSELASLMQQYMTDPVFLKWESVVLLCSFIQLLIRVFFGIVGNHLYFRIAKKRILSAKENAVTNMDVARMGGTSMAFGIIAYVITYLFSTFINTWFM